MQEVKTRPCIIAHRKAIQPDVERRIDEIDEWFETNHKGPQLTKLKGQRGNGHCRNDKRVKKLELQLDREIEEELWHWQLSKLTA